MRLGIVVALLVATILAQPVFERRWHWSSADLGRSVGQTSTQGYIISAETRSATDGFGMLVAAVDRWGDTVWVRHVRNMASGSGYACLGPDDAVTLAGRDVSGRIVACRFSSAGDSVWSYVSSWRGQVSATVSTADSGCLVVGRIPDSMYSFGAIRLDARGQERWAHCYPATGMYETRAWGVTQTSDFGFVVCGDGYSYQFSYARLIRIAPNGELVWNQLHRGQTGVTLKSVIELPGLGYIALGTDLDTLARQPALLLLWLDSAGAVVASRHLVPPAPSVRAAGLCRAGDGLALVAELDWQDSARVWLVRAAVMGETLWSRTFGQSERETPSDMVATADFGFAIVGSSDSLGGSVLLLKTDSLGRTVVGTSETAQPRAGRSCVAILPNPAVGVVYVAAELPGKGRVRVELCDITGSAVSFHEELALTTLPFHCKLDVDGLPAGTYLLRLRAGGLASTEKFVLQR